MIVLRIEKPRYVKRFIFLLTNTYFKNYVSYFCDKIRIQIDWVDIRGLKAETQFLKQVFSNKK